MDDSSLEVMYFVSYLIGGGLLGAFGFRVTSFLIPKKKEFKWLFEETPLNLNIIPPPPPHRKKVQYKIQLYNIIKIQLF